MTKERSYWFGRKRFGWGISPTSWQGWASVAVYGALMIATAKFGFLTVHPVWEVVLRLVLTVVFLGVMFATFDRSERM